MSIRFEWDESKRRANLRKHGFDFAGVEQGFEGPTFTVEDDRANYGESRFVTIGFWAERVVNIVHTETDDVIRIISIRKATRYEQEEFLRQIGY